jgi:Fe-S-cluster containining protein
MANTATAIQQYQNLRRQTDGLAAELEKHHAGRMVCRKGCCQCCTNLTVFPVEFFSIVEEMKQAGITKLAFDAAKACGYLDDKGECFIYPYRPIICRTQGLPLAFYDESQEGYSVTFCPKNFADADPDEPDFGPNNTLNLDKLNDELFEIHLQFLQERQGLHFTESTRIELVRLVEYL